MDVLDKTILAVAARGPWTPWHGFVTRTRVLHRKKLLRLVSFDVGTGEETFEATEAGQELASEHLRALAAGQASPDSK